MTPRKERDNKKTETGEMKIKMPPIIRQTRERKK